MNIKKTKKIIVKVFKPIIKSSPYFSKLYRQSRDRKYFNSIPKETPWGFKFTGPTSMQIGEFEPEETEIFLSIIKDVDVLVNVGANVGYYCALALSHNKYVYAFEPIQLNLNTLLKNMKINNWEDSIEVYPLALSNKKSGVIEIYGGGTGASLIQGWAGVKDESPSLVPISTLDNVISDKLINKKSLILVDVEGSEKYMLEGAISTFKNDPKPIWMIEINITEHWPKGVEINPNLLSTFQLFWDHGYVAKTANKENRLVTKIEIENIVNTGVDTLNFHNFLFS